MEEGQRDETQIADGESGGELGLVFEVVGEFDDFEGAFGPVVAPADDDVAGGDVVFVEEEVFAFEFEFDAEAAQLAIEVFPLGFAVGETGLDCFNDEAELGCEAAEEVDDASFVDRGVAEEFEVERFSVCDVGSSGRTEGIDRNLDF